MTSGVAAKRRSGDEGRLEWVDQAKGIGIILVVYGHVISGVRAAGISFDQQTFKLTWDALYAFHIPLFFFLSGLFFPQSLRHRGAAGLILNKVDTLVYPYILWSLLQGFLQVALSHHVNNPVTVGEVLSLLWHPRQEFWFLYALFFTYLIACVLYVLVPARLRLVLLAAAAAAYFLREGVPHVAALWYPAWYMVYFLAGALLPATAEIVVRHCVPALIAAAGIFAGAEVLLHQLPGSPWDPVTSGLSITAACAGTAATLALSSLFARARWHFVAYVGRMSLQIYLLHTMAAAVTRLVLQKGLGITNLEIHLIAGTAIGVLVPLAFAYALERWEIPGLFAPPRRFQLQQLRTTTRAC